MRRVLATNGWRQCSNPACPVGWYPPIEAPYAFRRRNAQDISCAFNGTVCIPCTQTAKDEEKKRDRYRAKAITCRKNHAKSLGYSVDQLERDYGWTLDAMARDFREAYENGRCPGPCHDLFSEMPNGLSDLTVDIHDKRLPPDYGINTKLMCRTDNQEKGGKLPEEWARIQAVWRRWREARTTSSSPEEIGLLFDVNRMTGLIMWQGQ